MTDTVARLRITLSDTDPVIWRQVDVPVEASLKMIHDVIQAAMGWQDYHLWEFEADDRRYGQPDPEWPDDTLSAAKNVKLKSLIEKGIGQLDYTYDMGDNWHHVIAIERRDQLGGHIKDNARFIVVQPGDSLRALETALSWSIFHNPIEGSRFGDPDFTPGWEWLADHGHCFEMVYIMTDDGFAHVVIVENVQGVAPALLKLCRLYITDPV